MSLLAEFTDYLVHLCDDVSWMQSVSLQLQRVPINTCLYCDKLLACRGFITSSARLVVWGV